MDYPVVNNCSFCPICDTYVLTGKDTSLPENQQWLKALTSHAGKSHGSRHTRTKFIRGNSDEAMRYSNLIRVLVKKHQDYLNHFNITKADILAVAPGKLSWEVNKLLRSLP